MANKILEITTYRQVSEVGISSTTSQSFTDSSPQISALTKQIEELTKRFDKFSSNRDKSKNRNRSSSRSKNDSPYCYYHFKFGAMAQKCTEPCKFKPNTNDPKN